MIRDIVVVTILLTATGCSTTNSSSEDSDLRADSSCDILYAAVEACHEFGSMARDAHECPAFSEEVRSSFDRGIEGLGEEFVEWIGEYCIEHCESGVNGHKVVAVQEVCLPLEGEFRK